MSSTLLKSYLYFCLNYVAYFRNLFTYKQASFLIRLYIFLSVFLFFQGIFRSLSFFMAANVRKSVAEGRSDVVPIFLGDIHLLFERKIVKPDVAIIQVGTSEIGIPKEKVRCLKERKQN